MTCTRLPTLRALIVAALLSCSAGVAQVTFVVDARLNSSTGGSGLPTISLANGQAFSVSVDPGDLWNAGALPRWSNANGLNVDRYAKAGDESGQPAGTQIGQVFSNHVQGNLSAPYGSLVGQIGSGDYFLIGTSFSGTAGATGTLRLYYWDSVAADNTGSITATVIPEPATYAVMLAAVVLAVAGARRLRRKA